MAKEDSKVAMVAVLTIIMILSATVLTFVFGFTKPKIDAYAAQQKKKAILNVLPGATKYKTIQKGNLELYKGYDKNGDLVGTAIETKGPGFQGMIKLMLGMNLKNDKVLAIKILSHLETPGLGARITEPWFENQFKNKQFNDKFKAKSDVKAIAGATISTQAVSDIIENTIQKVQKVTDGGE
ncbi:MULTISPECIES: RnfABCDGE type electron transport complex subunit G [unclassified Candidatus Frackibacter]|uniref:RnfABCDGE type electron transport complex subunit G n=1 Tax=unclassified Candidatus Frackibacter TaxID=2648818 RepID=UPI0007983C40|nr:MULTISPECIES: RnfABCDGE type electron transport complex subunit G [unclassified Candidatus Frackibacter]KXS37604.1 MAG: electron transport complex protein RnfG [Candidatus Frackibacter sp. T328-2]SDC41761.1 electron transport complex protein RnfG [Candidatus Frackibacter sp. WG11]SEM59259.1 electron transport complex protein RnfG [Candidatus Frackibacter sp. WG12]SFL62830.1 electron transport complex protein RnfG [Candidatus Frackibacter sp. WG13]